MMHSGVSGDSQSKQANSIPIKATRTETNRQTKPPIPTHAHRASKPNAHSNAASPGSKDKKAQGQNKKWWRRMILWCGVDESRN